jgi:hypothetical protein
MSESVRLDENRASVDGLVLDRRDNVATVLRAVAPGERIRVRTPAGQVELAAAEAIPLCHKIALVELGQGELVFKYGEPIGRMTRPVPAGGLVHVHSMRSERAKRA